MSNVPLPPTLTAEDVRVVALLRSEPEDWTYKCFEAAFVHLALAHRIQEIDGPMALFRAITAEEEAASGLLRALKSRGYAQPGLLKPKDHLQKAAVYPFLRAIAKHTSYLQAEGIEAVKLAIAKDSDPPRLELALVLGGERTGLVARPTPPLNLRIRETGVQVDYSKYFLKLITPTGFDDIRKYLDMKRNERNLLLYASPQGLLNPSPVSDRVLHDFKVRVMTILKATLLFWPYKEVQPFVEEAARSFLKTTGHLRDTEPADEA